MKMIDRQGIHGSTILTIKTYLNSLNNELKKLGKNGESELLFRVSRDEFTPETLWAKCKNNRETIVLVSTDLNSVIGCYCPEKWEDTKGKKNSEG